jgi:hypothetical protein
MIPELETERMWLRPVRLSNGAGRVFARFDRPSDDRLINIAESDIPLCQPGIKFRPVPQTVTYLNHQRKIAKPTDDFVKDHGNSAINAPSFPASRRVSIAGRKVFSLSAFKSCVCVNSCQSLAVNKNSAFCETLSTLPPCVQGGTVEREVEFDGAKVVREGSRFS